MLVRVPMGRSPSAPADFLAVCNLRQASPVLARTAGWSLDYANIAKADSRSNALPPSQVLCCCSCCRHCFCESHVGFRASVMLEWLQKVREVVSGYPSTPPLQALTRAQWAAKQNGQEILQQLASMVSLVQVLPPKPEGNTDNSDPITPEARRFVHGRILNGSAHACLILVQALRCRALDTPQGKAFRKLGQKPERLRAAIHALQKEAAKGNRASVADILAEKLKEQEEYSPTALNDAEAAFHALTEYQDWQQAEALVTKLQDQFNMKQAYLEAKTAVNSSPTATAGKDFEFFAHSNGQRVMVKVLQRNGDGITRQRLEDALCRLQQWHTSQRSTSPPLSTIDQTFSSPSPTTSIPDHQFASTNHNTATTEPAVTFIHVDEQASSETSQLTTSSDSSLQSCFSSNPAPSTSLGLENKEALVQTSSKLRRPKSSEQNKSSPSLDALRRQAESMILVLTELLSSLAEVTEVPDVVSWAWFQRCQALEQELCDNEWDAWVSVCAFVALLPVWRIASNYAIEYEAWRDARFASKSAETLGTATNTGEEVESKGVSKPDDICYVCGGQGHLSTACIKQKEDGKAEEEDPMKAARKERKRLEKEAKQQRREQSHRLVSNGEVDLFLYNAAAPDPLGGLAPKVLLWGEMKLNAGDLPKADYQRTEFVRKVLLSAQLRQTQLSSLPSSRFAPPSTRPHPRIFPSLALSLFAEPDCRNRCMFFCLLPNPAADLALPSFLSTKIQESLWLPSSLQLCSPDLESDEVRAIASSLHRSIAKKELDHPLKVTEPYLASGLEDNMAFFYYTPDPEQIDPDPDCVQNTSQNGWLKH